MTFKIDKGIPVPPKQGSRGCPYPWDEMQAGDSFSVAVPEGRDAAKYGHQIVGSGRNWAKHHAPGAKFTVRSESNGKAVRVWMVARPAPLNPLASVKVHRLNTPEDDNEDGRTPTVTERAAKKFAHEIPSFAAGAKARAVKGRRY